MLQRNELQRLHRRTARIALYGSLLLVGLAAVLLYSVTRAAFLRDQVDLEKSQSWADVDWEALSEVRLLQDYLKVDTNADDGDEYAGALYLAEHLEAAGLEVHIERLGERHANLWAILEGEEPEAVVLHNHIDVEPIFHPELWTVPPFGGTVEPPWIYGRGVFDMKSLAIAQLVSVMELAARGEKPRRSVIFLATGSEERGSDLGATWVVREHPEIAERAWVLLTEGGIVEAIDADQGKYWGTEFGQKQFVDLEICSHSKERLEDLRKRIARLRKQLGDLRVLPEVEEMMRSYAPTRDREDLRKGLSKPHQLIHDPAAFKAMPGYLEALFRSEAHPFPVKKKPGGGYHMTVKLHVLPGDDPQEVRRQLLPDWMLWGFDWALVERPASAHSTPTSHPAFQEIQRLLGERYPKIPAGPFFLPWTATDARFFRRAEIPSFGFSPFFILTPDTLTGANPNERIALPGYVQGVELYSELVQRLVR
jgi:acetylornithine deacetylase/succinyl-diaminopimelate desuccinylase-like protein